MPSKLPKSTPRSGRGGALSLIVALAAATTFVGSARGADEPPAPGDSAVIQYTELVPTGSGATAPDIGKKTRSSLPKKAKRALDNALEEKASALTVVATSSDYGAPSTTSATSKPVPRNTPSPTEQPSLDRTFEATAAAVAPVDDARMIGLLVALLAITFGGVALALRRPRGY